MLSVSSIRSFLHEVTIETKKVTFPSKQDTIATTWVVIGLVVVISIYISIVDFVLSFLLGYIT